MIKKYYKIIISFFSFAILTIIFTYPVIFKMSTGVYGPFYGTDNRGTICELWWLKYAWLNHIQPNFTTMLVYPFGADIATVKGAPLNMFVYKWLTILTNEIFVYNFILLLGFLLSAVFTYYLVYFLTKNRTVSFISGIIFAFCPYHFNKAWEHFGLAQTFWVPLYSLALLKLWKKPVFKNSLLVAVVFSLMLAFDLNYAYIMSVFTLGFIIFILFYKKSSLRFIKMFGLSVFIGSLINFSFIYPIFKTIFFIPKADLDLTTAHVYVRSFHYLFTHSARPLSYLLPSSAHPVFGNFTKSMFGSIFYGRNSIEQTLYLGWIPLILSFIAFRTWKRKRLNAQNLKLDTRYSTTEGSSEYYRRIPNTNTDNNDFMISFFIFTAILGFIFSMPPYINLGLFKVYFPSFFMYKFLPAYRSYARFGILVIFAVSILAGFGLKYILQKIKTPGKRVVFASFITCFILFEFLNIPPFHVTDLSNPPKVYEWVSGQKGDFAIAEYPFGEEGMGEAQMDYDFLFYQRIHQKPLINGASIGSKGYEVRKKIANLKNPATPGILKYLGAKYVIVHLDKYKGYRSAEVIGGAPDFKKQKGLKLIKKFGDAEVYVITAKAVEVKVD